MIGSQAKLLEFLSMCLAPSPPQGFQYTDSIIWFQCPYSSSKLYSLYNSVSSLQILINMIGSQAKSFEFLTICFLKGSNIQIIAQVNYIPYSEGCSRPRTVAVSAMSVLTWKYANKSEV